MPGFNKAKWLVILTVIVMLMNSCVSSQQTTAKKVIPGKKATTSVAEFIEEKASAIEIPSYPENVAFSEVTSFNEYVIGPGDVLTHWRHNLPL